MNEYEKLQHLIIKKDLIYDDVYDGYFDKHRSFFIAFKTNYVFNTLLNCYPKYRSAVPIERAKELVTTMRGEYIYHYNDVFFSMKSISIGFKLFGDKTIFYMPKKTSPLVVTSRKSKYFVAVAPMLYDWEYDALKDGDHFKKISGCSCPIIIDRKYKK